MAEMHAEGKDILEVAIFFKVNPATVTKAIDESGKIPLAVAKQLAVIDAVELVRGGKGIAEAAAESRVPVSRLGKACDEAGIVRDGKDRILFNLIVSKEQWESADWNLRDVDLGRLFGVCRERVRQIRKRLGKPAPENHRQSNKMIVVKSWLESMRGKVEQMTADDLLELCPFKSVISRSYLVHICRKIGIQLKAVGHYSKITKDNLISLVSIDASTGCWNWRPEAQAGYGVICKQAGHKFSYQLFYGPIPKGAWCLHTCDNPKCVNPSHLYLGNAKTNAHDRDSRGRGNHEKKFTVDQVIKYRKAVASGETNAYRLAKELDIGYATVFDMIRGKNYRHVKV